LSAPEAIAWAGPDILDAAPVQRADGDLLVLDAQGGICCLDLRTQAITWLGTVALPEQPMKEEEGGRFWITPRWRLYASADGAFAAAVFDGGRHGVVVQLTEGCSATMPLDGGDYHPETVPFSACFMEVGRQTVLLHRTAWNRLDASDPRTGRLLTERGPTQYAAQGERPEHYLDYFHGELRPGPGGSTLLFDAGWVWQPVGVPRVLDVQAWLAGNVWEAEDGPSVQWLNLREDWNFPACWTDGGHIALGGMGDWDDEEFETAAAPPGVRIVDVRAEAQAQASARTLRMDLAPQELFSDGYLLFAAHAGCTSAWRLDTGERMQVVEGFAATHHHRQRGLLLEVAPRAIRLQRAA
jgi:hypothetical protein